MRRRSSKSMLSYNRTMYHLIREESLLRSPTLSAYFKEVLIRPEVKSRMEKSKKRLKKEVSYG